MTIDAAPPSTEEDAALASRFREGDAEALGELYLRHFPSVYQTVGPRAGDPAAAEDLAQAAFLRAWEQRSRLADPGKFRPWLLTTARHLALDHRRRQARHGTLPVNEETPSREVGAETALVAAETPQLVWQAAASLEPRQREILQLTVRDELSTPEVASVLGISSAHAAVLVHRSRRALGAAIRTLLVATQARECARLRALVPAGRERLSSSERATVDRHMRRCPDCRAAADRLTAPSSLFGALPVLALPQGWDSAGLHALANHPVITGTGAAVGTAGLGAGPPPHGVGVWQLLLAGGGVAVAGAVATVLILHGNSPALPVASQPTASGVATAVPAVAAQPATSRAAGRVLVSGDDPDVHAHYGPNAAGARHLIQVAVAMVTGGKNTPRLLLITGLRDPGGPLFGDPRLGLHDAGLAFDVAAAAPVSPGVLDLRTVRFTDYDAVIVASDFGGWLEQPELDSLDARAADLKAYTIGGGGLLAFSEGGAAAVHGAQAQTTHGWYGFLPVASAIAPVAEYQAGITVTAAGGALGLTAADEQGNYVHATFAAPPGASVLVTDAAGRALAFSMTLTPTPVPSPSP